IYNRALRKTLYNYQLSSFKDENGYINLKIEKADGRKKSITTFTNSQQAKASLFKITEEYQLCQKLTGLYESKNNCFLYSIKECRGACIQDETPASYNERVNKFINKYSYENQNMLVIDHGRSIEERSVILIENGQYKGFGFYNLNYQINNAEVLKSIIHPMQNNRDARHIIQNYLRKNKVLKKVILSPDAVN
ncbi:MAG: exonuclease, partial [Flavobacteriaceae bacterium]|nr:exonuclease [Flavobacteriaceae bacterium]